MRLYGMYTICKSNGIQLEFELLVGVKERNNFKVNTIEIQNLLSLSLAQASSECSSQREKGNVTE